MSRRGSGSGGSTEQSPIFNPTAAAASGTAAGIQSGGQVLGFEREQFSPFFNIQEQLGQQLGSDLAGTAGGGVPPGLLDFFRRQITGAQTRRGLATSPIGATEEATLLAPLAFQARQQALGGAQQFLGGFRPTTGFLQPIQPGQVFQGELVANQQLRQNFASRQQRKAQERAATGQAIAGGISAVGGLFGPAGGALGGVLGAGIGGAVGGPQAGLSGAVLGAGLPSLFSESAGGGGGFSNPFANFSNPFGGFGGGGGILGGQPTTQFNLQQARRQDLTASGR